MKNILILILIVVSVSCGKKGGSSHKGKAVNQIFVNGDPALIIAGTKRDVKSFINLENMTQFDSFTSKGLTAYTEQEIVTEEESSESREAEDGQEAEEEDETADTHFTFTFQKLKDGTFLYSEPSGKIGWIFTETDKRLELTALKIGKKKYPATIEHYSVSADKTKMSFLATVKEKSNRILVSISLYKEGPKKVSEKTLKVYKYISGPGVLTPWKLSSDRTISIDVCPSAQKLLSSFQYTYAFEKWQIRSLTKPLKIKVNEVSSCKPFSDVNQHAIHSVDNYRTEVNDSLSNPGQTLVNTDFSQAEIYDADIIIFKQELEKADMLYNFYQTDFVLAHEFGHFLGLHHQFDGTKSLMSYDQTNSLESYDREAITELYGK